MQTLYIHVIACCLAVSLTWAEEPSMTRIQQQLVELQNDQQLMKDVIVDQQTRLGHQEQNILQLRKKYRTIQEEYNYLNFACAGGGIGMNCFGGTTIKILDADYGQYSQGCPENECCSPHPYDCLENVESANPVEWATLLVLCENQTSCNYLFSSSIFVASCAPTEIVDYMQVYYACVPDNATTAVGFSAYSVAEGTVYDENEVLQFEAIFSNLAGAFDVRTGIFACPYSGVYMFSHVVQALNSDQDMRTELCKENEAFGRTYMPNNLDKASLFAIVECQQGERVWIRSCFNGQTVRTGSEAQTTFSGYMLYRY